MDDFEVAHEDCDPRGWSVLSGDGVHIGDVRDLLVDPAAMKVRYLDVRLTERVAPEGDRHVLIPVGRARLHERSTQVFVDTLEGTAVAGIPRYAGREVTPDYERQLREGFVIVGITPAMLDMMDEQDERRRAFYDHEAYDDSSFFRGRATDEVLRARDAGRDADRAVERPVARERDGGEGAVERGRVDAGLAEPGVDVPRDRDRDLPR